VSAIYGELSYDSVASPPGFRVIRMPASVESSIKLVVCLSPSLCLSFIAGLALHFFLPPSLTLSPSLSDSHPPSLPPSLPPTRTHCLAEGLAQEDAAGPHQSCCRHYPLASHAARVGGGNGSSGGGGGAAAVAVAVAAAAMTAVTAVVVVAAQPLLCRSDSLSRLPVGTSIGLHDQSSRVTAATSRVTNCFSPYI
jgi:hypothetical protein